MKKTLLTALVAATLFGAAAHAATITPLNRDPAGSGLNDPTAAAPIGNNPGTTIGEQRRIAYQFAADLWGAVIQSNVEIRVAASFQPLSCTATAGTLGSAGAYYINRDFTGAPLAGTWYHSALANAIAGTNLNAGPDFVAPDDIDIQSQFNSVLGGTNPDGTACLTGSGFYFGLDGKTPAGKINFLDVVMHEIGHGLGFSGFLNKTTGALANFDGTPRTDVYTHFAYDNAANLRFDATGMTNATRAAAMKVQGRLAWDGANAKTDAPLALGPAQLLTASGAVNNSYAFFGVASFGPTATASNFNGQVVLVNDGVGPDTADACTALPAGSLTGKIAFINRGTCGFEPKTVAAQNAGAIGVIISNVATSGSPGDAPGMAEDPTVTATIPALSLNFADGNAFRTAFAAGGTINIALGTVAGRLSGADAGGRPLLYAPSVVAAGSTFSHYDVSHFPNALMEPNINQDLDANLRVDLTTSLFKDIGWTLNPGTGKMGADGTCDTRVAAVSTPGMIAGANLQAADKLCRRANPGNAAGYRSCIAPYITTIDSLGFLNASSRAAINRCAR